MLEQWLKDGMDEFLEFLENATLEELEADLKEHGYYDNVVKAKEEGEEDV